MTKREAICPVCGKAFMSILDHGKWQIHCTRECWHAREKTYRVDADAGIVWGLKGRQCTKLNSVGYVLVGGHKLAHRVIWESVHGPIADGLHINHINGIKTDNRICNLELATPAENVRHAWETGLATSRGEKNPQAKLTSADVAEIRAMRGRVPQRAIAAKFGIDQSNVSKIWHGVSWRGQ